MYILEEGFAYLIKDDKAFKVNFSLDGKMQVSEDDFIEVKDQKSYSYDEMYKKLNIKYFIEQKKNEINANINANEEMKEMFSKLEEKDELIEKLEKKIKELSLQYEDLINQYKTKEETEEDNSNSNVEVEKEIKEEVEEPIKEVLNKNKPLNKGNKNKKKR